MKKIFPFLFLMVFVFQGTNELFSQRLELRFNKEFSNDEIVNKAWGGGASLALDEFVQNVDFSLNFDYAGYKSGENNYYKAKTSFTKFKAGISALYVIPFKKSFYFRVGGDLSFNSLKKKLTNIPDETYDYVTHRGQMLGIGPVVSLQAKLGRVVRIGVNAIPTYLIPLSSKTDRNDVNSDFKKAIFVIQLQVGLEISLVGGTN